MSNKSNNKTATETMAKKHERMYRETPLVCFIANVSLDWQSGDMTLSRMQWVIDCNLGFLMRIHGYKAFFGKLERIGRLGKGNGLNPAMGRITPNEITAYLERCVEFIEDNGWDTLTAQEIPAP